MEPLILSPVLHIHQQWNLLLLLWLLNEQWLPVLQLRYGIAIFFHNPLSLCSCSLLLCMLFLYPVFTVWLSKCSTQLVELSSEVELWANVLLFMILLISMIIACLWLLIKRAKIFLWPSTSFLLFGSTYIMMAFLFQNALRQQRFVCEVTIQPNLCNEPW